MRRAVIGALVALAVGFGVLATPAAAHGGDRHAKHDRHGQHDHRAKHDHRHQHDDRAKHARYGKDARYDHHRKGERHDRRDRNRHRRISADDRQFLVAAARSAFAEIEQGRVATVRSDDPEVREFGEHLIHDHFLQLVVQVPLHRKFGVPIPGSTPDDLATLATLINTPDAEFDAVFLAIQVQNHEEALALFTERAENSDNRVIRRFARSQIPVLTEHLSMARALLEAKVPLGNIVEIAAANPDFSTLVTAVTAAGLVDTLAGEGPFTVFAPTNAAFAALPEGVLESLLADPQGALTEILTLHVVAGAVDSEAAIAAAGGTVDTLGGPISVELVGDALVVGGATVVTADIQASNGIIHVIDAVITEPAMAAAAT